MEEETKEKIDRLRIQIDELDKKIVEALNERAKVVLAIRQLKKEASLPIYDPKREEEIYTRLTAINHGPLYDDDIKIVYEQILTLMKSIEESA